MTGPFNENVTISEAFIQQIRNFLEHLYDFPYLQKQTLVLSHAETGYPGVEISGTKVRKLLLEALEKIGEEKSLAFRSSQARIYNLLRLHYIEGMNINDVAHDLGLSQRQTYRDLRSADEVIASILWSALIEQFAAPPASSAPATSAPAASAPPPTVDPPPGSQVADAGQQAQPFQPTNMNELITTVFETVRPLAASHEVVLVLSLPDRPAVVSTNAMIARQVVTGLLSMAIQKAQPRPQPRPLEIALSTRGRECTLRLSFPAALSTAPLSEKISDPSISLYAENLGWSIAYQGKGGQEIGAATCLIEVSMQTYQRTCLIIDDHPGFVDLMERYVDSSVLHIATADSGPKGIEMARQLHPDIIILDIMIPEIDGWQVLQTLHSAPATKTIPIIICSVFYDPDLALTLGAADVLKKPVRKEDLVTALKKLNIL
jgi:CheY-like chemotaxis protein